MAKRDIIVRGGSYGGVQAVSKLVSHLPADLSASIFIVLHVSLDSVGILSEILSSRGPLLAVGPRSKCPHL